MGIIHILHGIGMAQVVAFTARCLSCFMQGGSLKSYGVLVDSLTRQANMSFTLTGLILPLQQSLAYLLGEFSFSSLASLDISFWLRSSVNFQI